MRIVSTTQQMIFATLRIETGDGSGTGVIVRHQWADDKRADFLVTNKHVVADTIEGRLTFNVTNTTNGGNEPALGKSQRVVIDGATWSWTWHPEDEVDVAALPLWPAVSRLRDTGSPAFFRAIPSDLVPDDEELDAVEDVLFVGYPVGIFDQLNNLPIVRRGITATPPSVDFNGKPIFLIDGSVFPGSSGSPVFIYNNGAWSAPGQRVTIGSRFKFLGIVRGAYERGSEGSITYEMTPARMKRVIQTREAVDLGVVFKARTIIETIEQLLSDLGFLDV